MKTGIVLEGGAMRGMFTAGLLDVFMENGIEFNGVVGVSAGATFGCNLKSRQIGRTIRYNLKYCKDKRYASMESLIKTGDVFNAKFDYEDIPYKLDPYDVETFRSNPMDFWVVCTNVDDGRPIYHKCIVGDGVDVQWLRASASMPGLSNVVYCGGKSLTSDGPMEVLRAAVNAKKEKKTVDPMLQYREVDCEGMGLSDGGTSDSVPLKFMEDLGYDRILVICTQPDGYRKKKNKILPLLKLRLKEYPELLETLASRHIMYNRTMDYVEKRTKKDPERIMLIRPKEKLKIHKIEHDPKEIQRVYEIGREEGQRSLEAVKAFLQ